MAEAQYLEWCLNKLTDPNEYTPSGNLRRLFLEVGRKMGAWNLVMGHWRNNMALDVAQETVLWQIMNGISHQLSVEKTLTTQQRLFIEVFTNKLIECRGTIHQQILLIYQQDVVPPLTPFEGEVRRFFETSGPDPSTWRGELYPIIRELESQIIQENAARTAQQAADAMMLPMVNMMFPAAQNCDVPGPTVSGPLGVGFAPPTVPSPSKTPKRPRDKKRDAETKELRNKVNEASWGTPIDLVFAGSPEFDEKQREAVDRCKLAEVYQHKVYQLVPHLFHRHIFDPTATPTQLPQLKKNVMLDIRQLFGAWNFKTNGKDRGVSNKEWAVLQDTEDPRLKEWYGITEMLAKEKERQIIAGFIALDKPQKTRNYVRKPEDAAGHAPPMDFPMVAGICGEVTGSVQCASGDFFAYNGVLAAEDASNSTSQSRKRTAADRISPSDDCKYKTAKHISEPDQAE